MNFRSISVVLVLASLAIATSARADPASTTPEAGYDLGEIQSARSVAFGGAQAALGTSTTALYLNPANLPLARVYHFEAVGSVDPEARRQSYGGGVVDSSTSRLAGGVAGTWNLQDPDGINRTWTDLRLAVGYPLGDRFSVGGAARYLRLDQASSAGPLPLNHELSSAGPILNVLTFDVGATLVPIDGFKIAAVGHNLTNPAAGLAPTTLQGGIGYGTELFSLEADALADFTTWGSTRGRYMAGGELFLAGHVPLRLGYRYDDGTKNHAISGGLGYVEKAWSFEVGARHDVVGDHPDTLIIASVRFFYNPETGSGGGLDTSNQAF
ncbi:MAG TPA: hypothetical protein VGI39_20205 [Polyangiaceae bacterium]|jgi:hypothetical protein